MSMKGVAEGCGPLGGYGTRRAGGIRRRCVDVSEFFLAISPVPAGCRARDGARIIWTRRIRRSGQTSTIR